MFASLFFSSLNAGLLLFKANLKRANDKNQGCMPPLQLDLLVGMVSLCEKQKNYAQAMRPSSGWATPKRGNIKTGNMS